MRILQNIGIENRLAAGNKGIPTNGESVKVRYLAAVLLFIRRYQNTEPPGQYPEFSWSRFEPVQT